MLVSQTSPVGVELFSYANAFSCIDVGHVSENTIIRYSMNNNGIKLEQVVHTHRAGAVGRQGLFL